MLSVIEVINSQKSSSWDIACIKYMKTNRWMDKPTNTMDENSSNFVRQQKQLTGIQSLWKAWGTSVYHWLKLFSELEIWFPLLHSNVSDIYVSCIMCTGIDDTKAFICIGLIDCATRHVFLLESSCSQHCQSCCSCYMYAYIGSLHCPISMSATPVKGFEEPLPAPMEKTIITEWGNSNTIINVSECIQLMSWCL